MEILSTEPITWKIYKPIETKDFPCMICHREIGTIRLKCKMKSALVNLVVCRDCASLDPAEILDRIKE